MGYFNIFYKITRIIDMLTRKRNRKAIMVILIIIAIVCLYKTRVQANESFDYRVDYYMRVNRNFDATGQITYTSGSDSTGSYAIYSYIFPVYSGYSYNIKWTNTSKGVNFGFLSDLSGINLSASTTYNIAGLVANSITTGDFTYTANQDGFLIIGSTTLMDYYYPSGITDPSLNMTITTDYDGTSNYTTLHNDLLRIESLLRDYLYGDVNEYDVTNIKAASNRWFSQPTIATQNNWTVFYFPNKKNYTYNFNWSLGNGNLFDGAFRIGYSDSVDIGVTVDRFYNFIASERNTSFTFTSNSDLKYIVYYIFTGNNNFVYNVNVTSNYNYGREYGLYGGLTDINNQTKQQGEQTRETITSTDYNQGDVEINSDSISNVDTTQTDGLFTTIFNNFNNAATGGVDSISIPLPHNSGNLVLYSNLVSSHLGALSALVSAFWYFVFGFYAFKFVNNLLHNIKDGSILDGFKNNNEVITQDML